MSYTLPSFASWTSFKVPTAEESEAFYAAFSRFVGDIYQPLEVQSQIEDGINYRFLCKVHSPSTPNLHHLALVDIRSPIKGSPAITNISTVQQPENEVSEIVKLGNIQQAQLINSKDGIGLKGVVEPYPYFLYNYKIVPKNNPSGKTPTNVDYWPYYLILEETGIGYNPGTGPVATPTPFSLHLAPSQIGTKGIKIIAKNTILKLDIDSLNDNDQPTDQGENSDSLLLQKTAYLHNGQAESAEDISGFDNLTTYDNKCFQFYESVVGLSTTQAVPVYCPVGLDTVKHQKLDYRQAIERFHSGHWGLTFVSLTLSKPTVLEMNEAVWEFITPIGEKIIVGAESGQISTIPKITTPKVVELV